MYKIGITGSIGTGKSTVASMLSLLRIPIFDADKEIKNILNRQEIKNQIKEEWPQIIIENVINKLELRSIIFSRKNEKKKLEKLLYPHLETERKKFEKANKKRKILAYDVPLIYETKSQNKYDLILLTNCDEMLQKKRVLKRDKISNALFTKIVKSQLTFNEKMKFKPKVINTNNLKLFVFIEIIILFFKILIISKAEIWKKIER